MDCKCIKNDFNFDLSTISCGLIKYKDLSTWMEEDYYIIPEEYTVKITPPGGFPIEVILKVQEVNKLSSENLFSNPCFLDGIYCFSTSSCGIIYTRNIAIMCNLECKLANLVKEASKTQDDDLWKKVISFKAQLDAIYAHSEINNINLANEQYKILKKELDKINCNC